MSLEPDTATGLPPEIEQQLAADFAGRARQRMDRVNTALATLRPYERRLVREAAVMGYVLGHRDGGIDARHSGLRTIPELEAAFPHDGQILADVVAHCDSSSDTYPYIGEACDGRRRRITAARRWPGEEATS